MKMSHVYHKIVEYHNIPMSEGVFLTTADYSSYVLNWRFVRDSEKKFFTRNFGKKDNSVHLIKSTGGNKKSVFDMGNSGTGGINHS